MKEEPSTIVKLRLSGQVVRDAQQFVPWPDHMDLVARLIVTLAGNRTREDLKETATRIFRRPSVGGKIDWGRSVDVRFDPTRDMWEAVGFSWEDSPGNLRGSVYRGLMDS